MADITKVRYRYEEIPESLSRLIYHNDKPHRWYCDKESDGVSMFETMCCLVNKTAENTMKALIEAREKKTEYNDDINSIYVHLAMVVSDIYNYAKTEYGDKLIADDMSEYFIFKCVVDVLFGKDPQFPFSFLCAVHAYFHDDLFYGIKKDPTMRVYDQMNFVWVRSELSREVSGENKITVFCAEEILENREDESQ